MIWKVPPSLFAIAIFLVAAVAQGGTVVTLSGLSSDETPAEMLDASLTFSVVQDILTVSVSNETQGADSFDISAVYFNAAANVESLMLTQDIPGWTLLVDQKAAGFGRFDFALQSDMGHDRVQIEPGATLDFEFLVVSNGPVADLDFASRLSATPPGNNPAVVVAKFVRGPGDDSAFGAVVPEPATLTLLGACLGISLLRRSRRCCTGTALKTDGR